MEWNDFGETAACPCSDDDAWKGLTGQSEPANMSTISYETDADGDYYIRMDMAGTGETPGKAPESRWLMRNGMPCESNSPRSLRLNPALPLPVYGTWFRNPGMEKPSVAPDGCLPLQGQDIGQTVSVAKRVVYTFRLLAKGIFASIRQLPVGSLRGPAGRYNRFAGQPTGIRSKRTVYRTVKWSGTAESAPFVSKNDERGMFF